MLHIVFYQPRIPGNTGAAIRLSACTGAFLHVVDPLFDMSDTRLKRAGLDYHDLALVRVYDHLDEVLEKLANRIWAFTGEGNKNYNEICYLDEDALLFGSEPYGLPEEVLNHSRVEEKVRIPMRKGARSLNLTNAASIAIYEAWKQLGFIM